ncbi:MAG: iron ABC transporter permease [Chloroflexi bacterium]|nr:iron ABC transporter permease [Chloroflexota bacterium]
MFRHRALALILLTLGLLLISSLLSLSLGAVAIPLSEVWKALFQPQDPALNRVSRAIVWDLRLARTLLALVIGVGLAVSGSAYQALFRNPLADPYIIGASGGAALGATMAITLEFSAVTAAAFTGSLLAVAAVYLIAQAGGHVSAVNLILAGAALSALLSAAVSLLMFFGDEDLIEVFAWLMGGLSGRSWPHLRTAAPLILVGALVLWSMARPLDALTFGEESAQALGLNLFWIRSALVTAATIATAAAVAAAGVIGFVGLLAPHMARRLVGASHAWQIPMSALLGGLLVVLADDLARTLLAPLELPVGALTALLGAPFFLWLLKRGEPWSQ